MERFSEEHLELAVEAADLGLWSWDLQTDELTWTVRCKAIFGIDAAASVNYAGFLAALHPEDRARIDAEAKTAIRLLGQYDVELRALWPDGSVHWMACRGRVVCDQAGAPVKMLGVAAEIGERKQAELALRESDERYRALFEAMEEGYAVCRLIREDGNIVDYCFLALNRAFERIVGIPRARALGKLRSQVFDGNDRDWIRIYGPAVERHQHVAVEHYSDSLRRWFRVRVFPRTGDDFAVLYEDITDHKARDETSRRRTAQFETLLNEAPIGIYLVDSEFKLRHLNPVARQAFSIPNPIGADFAEAIGALWPAVDAETIVADFRRTLETGEPHSVADFTSRHHDGSLQSYEWHARRILLPEGGYGVVCYYRDISAETQARLAREESEARLQRALTIETVGITFFKTEGRITFANDTFLRMSGYSRQDLENGLLRWDTMTPPEWTERSEQAIEEFKRVGHTTPYEKEYLRQDGKRWWGLFAAKQVGPGEGIEFVLDITERKQAEAALRNKELQFSALGRTAPAFLYRLLPNGTVDSITPSFYEFTALPSGGVNSIHSGLMSGMIHPEELERVGNQMYEAATAAAAVTFEFRLRRADGSYRWWLTHLAPEFDPAGRLLCHYGAAFEIHAQKETEQALREADRRKDEFLAMLAHELRNPLAPLQMAADLIARMPPEDPAQANMGSIIQRQVAHMSRMVGDLLDVSRLNSGKITLQKSVIRLAEVVDEALESCRPALEQSGHHLSCEVADEFAVDGDKARLTQVLTNLLGNAIKFTPPGGKIGLRVSRSGDDWVELAVRDSGIGIAPEARSRIFELFAQEDTSLEHSGGGLGLGLTLVKRLSEMHGGAISVRSGGLGKGAEFIVKLPRLRAPALSQPLAAPARKSGDRLVILIVEDNLDAAESFQLLLQASGHIAYVANDGHEALRLFEEVAPAIVFMDLGLPGIDGYAVARRLRASNGQRPVLIAISGYGREQDKMRAREAGFDDHLTKPVNWQQLQALLTRYNHRAGQLAASG